MEITNTTTLPVYVECIKDTLLIEHKWTIDQDRICKFTFQIHQFIEGVVELIYIVLLKDFICWHSRWPCVSKRAIDYVINNMESFTNNDSEYNNNLYNVIHNYENDDTIMDIIHVAINNAQDKHCPCINKMVTPRLSCTCVSKDKISKWISEGVIEYVGQMIECLLLYVLSQYCTSIGVRTNNEAYKPSNNILVVTKTAIEYVSEMTILAQCNMEEDNYRDVVTSNGITTTTTLKQQIDLSMNTYLTGQKMTMDREADCKRALVRFMFNFQYLIHQIINIVYPAAMNMCQCSHCITGTLSVGSIVELINYIEEYYIDEYRDEEQFNINGVFWQRTCQDDTIESLVLIAVQNCFNSYPCNITSTFEARMVDGIMPHIVFIIDWFVALIMANYCKPINQHTRQISNFGLHITGNIISCLSRMAEDMRHT